jgi:cysteine-rich repeat protein
VRTIALAAALAVAGCNQLFGLDPIGGADDPRCGDGTIDPGAGEQCDDGDRVPGDGCDDACQFEDGVIGCSDGERDGFVDVVAWPGIAACAGRWVVPGTMAGRVGLNCARAGDDTGIADGCAMADLCAVGWRPCQAADLDVGDCPETPGVLGRRRRLHRHDGGRRLQRGCRRGSRRVPAVRADPRPRLHRELDRRLDLHPGNRARDRRPQ